MNLPEKRINEFIDEHHVLTLATSSGNQPWCASCFYAWLPEEAAFVFTSDADTKHIKNLEEGNVVAGNIVLETKTIGKIRGIQFRGSMVKANGIKAKKAKKEYLKRFPYAALMKTQLWILEADYIKMTDNRLGFGKKLIWERGK